MVNSTVVFATQLTQRRPLPSKKDVTNLLFLSSSRFVPLGEVERPQSPMPSSHRKGLPQRRFLALGRME